MQKAAAKKRLSKKENPVDTSITGHAAMGGNDLSTTKVVEEVPSDKGIPQATNNEENVYKRKEIPNSSQEKTIKKSRIEMAAKKKPGKCEISQIELHRVGEPSVLTLYARKTVIPPTTEKAVEETQKKIKKFIPQVQESIIE